MKKVILSFVLILLGTCAFAQNQGGVALGVNIGVAPVVEDNTNITNFGVGAKLQYNITDPVRLEVAADYWFKSDGIDVFDAAVNAHYIVPITNRIRFYPLLGVGYARVAYNYDSYFSEYKEIADGYGYGGSFSDITSGSISRLLVNIGIGFEYSLTRSLSLGIDAKFQYIKDYSRMPLSLSLTHRF